MPDKHFANFFGKTLDLHQCEPSGASATLHDLPTELLERIFFFATEFRYSYLTLDEAARILLNICRVCRYWRAVALSAPELWGRLINVTGFSDMRLANFLELSRPRHIELFLDGGPECFNRHLSDIHDRFTHALSELFRISYLVIRRFSLTRGHHLCLSKPAPALQMFSFEGHGSEPVHLPFPLFKEAPELRSLHLDAATIDFERANYPKLIEFRVRNIRDPFSPLISTWAAFFAHHPFLQSLDLSHVVSLRTSDLLLVPTIHLDQLQEFTLADDATQCAHILSRIIVPNTCRISLLCGFDNADGLRFLQDTVSTLMTTRLSSSLRVTLSETSIAFSNAVQGHCNISLAQCGQHFSFRFQWQSTFKPFYSSGLPGRPFGFLSDESLRGVETLSIGLFPINGRCPLDDVDLFCAFSEWVRRLNSVKYLVLDTNDTNAIFDLVNDPDGDLDDRAGEEGLSLPSLEVVEFIEVGGEELDWGTMISFAEYRYHATRGIKQVTVAKAELDHLHWSEASEIADLGLEINLKCDKRNA